MSSEFQVLARKYRPQRFQDLVGQESLAATLRNAIASGRIAHAFLFTGIRGVGKTTAARLLARALNCEKSDGPTPDPCEDPASPDACSNCREIAASSSVDVAEIDGASNRGIDSIRELTENVRYAPAKGRFRVYIIDEAHMVTREGFNALLKTLEEPPRHVKFIFATTAVDKFPDTIVSRCQRYDFKRIPFDRIAAHLRDLAEREGVTIDAAALYPIARESEGSMRDAESLLDRLIAFAGKKIDARQASEILGVADRATVIGAADAVLATDARTALEIVDRMHESSTDLERFTRDLLEHWRNLVVAKVAGGSDLLRDLPEEDKAEIVRQAGLRPLADLQRLFRIVLRSEAELRGASQPRLVVEMMMVRQAALEPAIGLDEALTKLEEIEQRLGASGGGAPRPGPAGGGGRTAAPTPKPERATPPHPPASPSGSPQRGEAGATPLPVGERIRTYGVRSDADPREAGSQTAGGRPDEAEPPGEGERAAAKQPVSIEAVNGAEGWNDLLERVRTRRISLYLNLMQARALECRPGAIVIGVPRETNFHRELSRRENVELLEGLAGEHFGTPTSVRIEALEESLTTARENREAEVRQDPFVRRTASILGGEVREVREPRR